MTTPTDPTPMANAITPLGRPLQGIRVLSMEQAAALPFATRHLADLGAEIIRLESPNRAPVVPGTDLFRNKQRIALDLSQEAAPEAFRRIAATCHIVAHNYTPRVMRKYGIDYPSIKNIKPDIIYLSLTGFGTTGPWGERPLFGPGAEAISGQNNLIGEPDAWPGRPGTIVYADNICGLHALTAMLAALERLERTGKGQHIDISLYETAISQIGPVVAERAQGGNNPARTGNHDPRLPIHDVFPTHGTDRHIAITATNDQLPALAAALNIPTEMRPEHPAATNTSSPSQPDQISSNRSPDHNRTSTEPQPITTTPTDQIFPEFTDQFAAALADELATRTAEDVAQLLQSHGIPASPVHNAADHLQDPHLWSRNYFGLLNLNQPGLTGTYPTAGPVWGGGPPTPKPPHHVGADTRAALLQAGYTSSEADSMFQTGAAVDKAAHNPSRPTPDPQIRIDRGELLRIDPPDVVRTAWTTSRDASPPNPPSDSNDPAASKHPRSVETRVPRLARVLDISTGDIATAYATKLLAEVGYDVVKLDSPQGDPLRILPSRWGGTPGGTLTFLNHGKRNLLLENPNHLQQLAAAADIVIGNFSQTTPTNIDEIGPAAFAELMPKAAVISVSPFGLTGARAHWAASDLVVQAASSLMFLTGEHDQPPQQLPPYAAAMTGGLAAASAAVAALISARKDGLIRRIDVAQVEAMATLTYSPTSNYAQHGELARREQRIKQALRMVPASDRFVYCAPGAVSTARMDGVARLIDEPRLAEDRFQTAEGRMQNYDEYLELFVPPFQRQTAQQWFEQAEALHLTFALVQTIDDLFSCPQLAARNMLREVPGPDGHPIRIPGRPFRLEDGPPAPTHPAAHTPGQHTDEVLRDWLQS